MSARPGPDDRPRVSVVLCVVDPHPDYFPRAVASVLAQTESALELIVVEEPSSASAAPLLARFDDPRIRHLPHSVRTSLVEQRNRGTEAARAPWIAVMDADDVCEPDRLATQLEFVAQHPDVDVVGSRVLVIDEEERVLGERRYPLDHASIAAALPRYNPLAQPTVLFRRERVRAAGGYRYGRHPATEDYELWCRLAAAGARFANVARPLLRYRVHAAGAKTAKVKGILRGTLEVKRTYFGGAMDLRARARYWTEHALLALPGPLVVRLFLRTALRPAPAAARPAAAQPASARR